MNRQYFRMQTSLQLYLNVQCTFKTVSLIFCTSVMIEEISPKWFVSVERSFKECTCTYPLIGIKFLLFLNEQ